LKSSYTFTYTPTNITTTPARVDGYHVQTGPVAGAGNGNFYYTDESGVIRQNTSASASSTDSPLAG